MGPDPEVSPTVYLGGGFKRFWCSPLFGEMIQFWRSYFSNGLKPPTSYVSEFLSNCGGERGSLGYLPRVGAKLLKHASKLETPTTDPKDKVADLSPIETCSETIRHRWYQAGSKYWWDQGLARIQGQNLQSENYQNHGRPKSAGELYFPETTLGTISLYLFMVMFALVIG